MYVAPQIMSNLTNKVLRSMCVINKKLKFINTFNLKIKNIVMYLMNFSLLTVTLGILKKKNDVLKY